MDYINANMIIQ